MKKNITINLCGRLFAIDEDAYEMLSTYEQSLRNYFRTREGGEEIANDIEERIAELLDELKAQGTEAITIEHVTEVIHRIGKPEEMEESPSPDSSLVREGEVPPKDSQESPFPNRGGAGGGAKRLYRNPNDKKLFGVLSGFAAYFGGDVLWWRLGDVACVLLSFVGSSFNFLWFLPGQYLYFHVYFWGIALIIAYVLLAVLMPVAETPEDRLRMKGKEVNPQNLAEEIVEQNNTAEASTQQYATTTPGHKGPSGCVSSTFGCIGGFFVALWTVVVTLFRWCLYAFGAFVAVMCLVGIVCLTAFAVNPYELLEKGSDFFKTPEFAALVPSLTAPFYIFVVAAVLVLAITAYAIIHSLLNEFKQMQSMPYRQRIVLLVSWIMGLIVAGVAFGYGVPKFIEVQGKYDRERWQELDAQYREEHTHDGIFVPDDEWEWLQDNGWKILNAEGCNDRFTAHGEYMTGDYSVRYLDCWDDHHRQRYRVERTDTLRPGTYRLTCAARANGTGACVYVIVGDEKPQFIEIPATGNEGGSIWEEANQFVQSHPNIAPDSVEYGNKLCELIDVNNGKGFGWSRITIEPIHITKPTALRYGLTSDDAFTGKTWLGQYFSATDFEVSLFEDATRRREAKNPTPQTSEVASQDSSSVQDGRMVIVRRGETLAIIARRNHTTVGRLRQLNHLHNNHVRVGQRLRVR